MIFSLAPFGAVVQTFGIRKAFRFICAGAIASLLVVPDANAVGTYLLNEKFNDMATNAAPTGGWTSTATSDSVQVKEYPFAADKSVRIGKTAGSGESSLSRTFASQGGRVAFEAKVMTRATTSFKACPYIYDGNGIAVVSVALENGNIESYIGSTKTVIQPFVANDWYMIRVVINTATNTYDLFIDGVRKLNNAAVRNTPAGGTLGQLKFYMDGVNTGILYVDNVKIWELSSFIGSAPTPIFDVRDYGATGNGSTNDTAAIQNAINACTGTGGSVLLANGNFVAGTLHLQSNMTFFIDYSAQLSSTGNGDDYPKQSPPTTNNQLLNCRRAQLYAVNVTNLTIDGGGTIYGQGDTGQTNGGSWFGAAIKEAERPITIWTVVSNQVTIQNIYVRLSAMWTIVPMETDNLLVKDVLLNVDCSFTHDGIDLVDCRHALVQDCTVYTGDDSFCPKTGIRHGVDDLVIKDCFAGHAGSNGYKFGTASYGGFTNALIQDCYVKNATYAAMVLMSRNGANVSNINFSRLEFSNCGAAFFVFLGQQPGHPDGDVDKLGYIDNVHFTDILCSTDNSTSNKWGSNVTGQIYNNVTYPITNLFFTNCNITFKGGDNSVPGNPPEWDSNQYPEVSMWGDLPAYGYYMRHVNGVTFTNCVSRLNGSDSRPEKSTNDVSDLSTHVDTDNDGMPNDWEQQYFGSTTGGSPTEDNDGDGMTNYAEYVAGTNPKDPADRLAPVTVSSDGTTVTIAFRSVSLKRYIAEYSDGLTNSVWTQMGNILAADSNILTVTDTPGSNTPRFYRLRPLID
ncbi:MAG TPA: glycosyl hydrolase family 28 protein [Chthoniobacterales bacterium]